MKKRQSLVLLSSLALVLGACGGGGDPLVGSSEPSPGSSALSPTYSGVAPTTSEPSSTPSSSSPSSSTPAHEGPTITFVTNGGTPVESVSGKKGDVIDYSKFVTTREGKNFVKWAANQSGLRDAPTTFPETDLTLYAIWEGDFNAGTVFYGRYPQGKVADSGLLNHIKNDGKSEGNKLRSYGGKTYYEKKAGEYYVYDYIRWDCSTAGTGHENVYILTSQVVLDYAPVFTSMPSGWSTMNDYEKNRAMRFENSSLYAWLREEFFELAFTEEQKKDVFDVTLPTYNQKNKASQIFDWVTEASDYALSLGDRTESLVAIPVPDSKLSNYDYWFASHNGQAPGNYFLRSAESLSGGDQVKYFAEATRRSGVVPQIEVDLNETVTKTIHFDPMGGEAVPDLEINAKVGREISLAPSSLPEQYKPVKEGYLFNQWYYDDAYTQPVYAGENIVIRPEQESLTLYAHYQPLFRTLKFETNGGEPIDPMTETFDRPQDVTFTLPENPERRGYEFAGWYYDIGLTRKVANNSYTFDKVEDATEAIVYASWVTDDNPYPSTLIIHPNNGGEIEEKTIYSNAPILSQIGAYTYDAYHRLAGWCFDEGLTEDLGENYRSWKNETVDVYAKWVELDHDEVDFVFNPIRDGEAYEILASDDFAQKGELKIPATHNNKPVVKIADKAFAGLTDITAFAIPAHIEEIGKEAFAGTSIAELAVPNITYAPFAFAFMEGLKKVTIDASVEELTSYLFYGDSAIAELSLPTIKKLGSATFGKIHFSEFTIGESLEEIIDLGDMVIDHLIWANPGTDLLFVNGGDIFRGCTIGKLTIGANVTALPSNMVLPLTTEVDVSVSLEQWCGLGANELASSGIVTFGGAALTGEVTIPEGVTAIPNGTFYQSTITKLTLPSTLTTVDPNALEGMTTLTEVEFGALNETVSKLVLPDTVTKIVLNDPPNSTDAGNCFRNAAGLKELEINGSCSSLVLFFESLGNLEKLTLGEGVNLAESAGMFASPLNGLTSLKELTVNEFENINEIFGSQSVHGTQVWTMPNLEKLTVRNGTVGLNVGPNPYENIAPKLTEVVLGNGVTKIADYAFANATALQTVTMGTGLTEIGKQAFSKTAMTDFVLPSSVTSIGLDIFKDTSSMATLSVAEGNTRYSSPAGSNFILDDQEGGVAVTIPTSGDPSDYITTATANMYSNVSQETFSLPKKITTVKANAFSGASIKVLDLTASPNVKLESGALAGIVGLQELRIANLTSSPTTAFGSASAVPNLITVTSQTLISSIAGDKGVKNLVYEKVYMGNLGAFKNCTNLVSFTAPKLSGIAKEMFMGCTNLTTVVAPMATKLNQSCFSGCTKLHTVDVYEIGDGANDVFKNCKNLGVLSISGEVQYLYTSGSSMASGAIIEGVLINEYSSEPYLPSRLFAGATIGWVVLPVWMNGDSNSSQSFVEGGTIGKTYYCGTKSQFSSNYTNRSSYFDSDTLTQLRKKVLYYSYQEAEGCWHYVDGLPVEW